MIPNTICGGVPSYDTSNEFLDVIGQKIKEFEKVKTENLMSIFTNARLDTRDYIMRIDKMAMRLKELNVPVVMIS